MKHRTWQTQSRAQPVKKIFQPCRQMAWDTAWISGVEREGTNCQEAWELHPTKYLATGQQRKKHKQKQQKAAHTSRLSGSGGTRRVGDTRQQRETRVVNNNVCPENTTQLVFCGSRKEGPSILVPFALPTKGRSRGEGNGAKGRHTAADRPLPGRRKRAREDAAELPYGRLCVFLPFCPPVSPRVFAVFLPVIPFRCFPPKQTLFA